jgi:hypothetical protein
VARTLSRSRRIFLADTFQGNGELADQVNHLLVAGFYPEAGPIPEHGEG